MNKSLKAICDEHFSRVKFDNQFKNNVELFIRRFAAKNDDHVNFLGGNLIGVYPLRWNYTDGDTWWDDIFGVVEEGFKQDLLRHPEIKANRVVSSDALNHAMVYAIHRVHHSPHISDKDKEGLKARIMLAMNLKFLSSLMAHYFRYPADKGIAEKTFNRLSKRYDLKVLGSWQKMLIERSKDFIAVKGRYYKSYVDYTDDIEIIKMINDAQGRIRETVKDITTVYHKCLAEDAKVLSSSSSVEIDGTVMLKDIQRKASIFNRYIKSTVTAKDSFVKEPLLQIVYRAVPSLEPDMFDRILETFVTAYNNPSTYRIVDDIINDVLTFSFDFIKANEIPETDISAIIYRLKHVYMSGRVTDEMLIKARNHFDKLVVLVDRKLKGTPLVPERCALFLYIMIRTLTMNYYKN